MYFYDTCALLNELHHAFNNYFCISNITLKELENIKSSAQKDSEIKFKARRLINLLETNQDKYSIINYRKSWDDELKFIPILSDNNDSRIILTAYLQRNKDLIFITQDLYCKQLAKTLGLNVRYLAEEDKSLYKGFQEIECNTDEELAELYNKIYNSQEDFLNKFLLNEYLIIKYKDHGVVNKYKRVEDDFVDVYFPEFKSDMFGKIKPKDCYQLIAMDSLANNQITMLRGKAGTGKTLISLGYLFSLLEKNKIDKIVIFCNTVATAGAAKLGLK